jgi:aspartate dehydrogenase
LIESHAMERLLPVKIALLGLGAVGEEVLRHLAAINAPVRVLGALVAHPQRSRPCATFGSLEALLESHPDLVVECARQPVLENLGPRILASGKNLVLSSVGALAAEATHEKLTEAAQQGGARMFIPAGALAGIDALAAARHVGISSVRYTRLAPPSTWVRSGAMAEADAGALSQATAVFEGTAREAAQRYPKNANVTATIALAGIGFERTHVRLMADPAATANVHVIEADGPFGTLKTEISAAPITGSTSSRIVAGSLVRAVLSHIERIAV